MEITNRVRRRILWQTIFFVLIFLMIGAGLGYYIASMEAASKILMELNK